MGRITKRLSESVSSGVFDSPKILKKYSKDASPLTITPELVIVPESVQDIQKILNVATPHGNQKVAIPVTVRGSGMGNTGAALSEGVIVSTAKLDNLLDIDARERLVRVQPGITLKELNKILSVNGICIPIYGHDNDTIGGLISTAPKDPYSGKYRGITRYVRKLEIMLASGDLIQTHRLRRRAIDKKINSNTTEGALYQNISKLITAYSDTINKISRDNVSMAGYPNITQVMRKKKLNLTPLFYGAEGTLGIITEVTLKAVPIQKNQTRVIATFRELHTAKHFLDVVSSLHPRRLEMYDNKFVHAIEAAGKKSSGIMNTVQKGFVVYAEFDQYRRKKIQKIRKLAPKLPSTTRLLIESKFTKTAFDEFDRLVNNFLIAAPGDTKIPTLKDIFIPTWNLSSFINDLELIENSLKLDILFHGSYSSANFHLIPKFDDINDITPQKIAKLYDAIFFFIRREGGSIAGGTPEGRTKAPITNAELTSAERDLYLTLKHIFDPYDILNPSAKLGASPDFAIDKLSQ